MSFLILLGAIVGSILVVALLIFVIYWGWFRSAAEAGSHSRRR
jgi:hypothetical protein